MKDDWIKIENLLPKVDKKNRCSKYILLSFENFSLPAVGRYEEDKDGSGAFYIGDDAEPAIAIGLVVNGWQPLPKCLGWDDV